MAAHRPCDACLKRTTSRPSFDLNARAGMCGTKAYSMVAAVGRHRKVRAMDMIAKQRQGYMMPTESGPRWTHVVARDRTAECQSTLCPAIGGVSNASVF
jgi:hypothetical protein